MLAGPTASGKSARALDVAVRQGRTVVNADALQVYAPWRVLTARPSRDEEAAAPHALYGHVPFTTSYSVGHWLRDLAPLLAARPAPIIVGGTGLFFRALTEGLADIPAIPAETRALAEQRLGEMGLSGLAAELDRDTQAQIDLQNPARVLRAWEVMRATGRGLASWQRDTPPPLLPLEKAAAFVIDAPRDWLAARIERRFDQMLAQGALEEARAVLPAWDPALPAAKAIGAPELIGHLNGAMELSAARNAAIIATRQYAKRQRTWLRARMGRWTWIRP